ncbi:MAG: hypothetical protein P0111_16515 [Nitrospira sp.]|nr:hypothetical protein [Nitrospira sp.]
MAKLNIPRTRSLLQKFEFRTLFIEELGWSQPSVRKPTSLIHDGIQFAIQQIAELSGVVVLEIMAQDGAIPNAKIRAAAYKSIARQHHENLLIFLDRHRTQSLWYWVKREGSKTYPREHIYVQGQPGDLFLSKLSAMVFDISELDELGRVPVVEVAGRLREALDVEKVTKKFYREFSEQHLAFLEYIRGIANERDRRWYASVLLNRLMFIYFLQRKGFIDNGNFDYLQTKLAETRKTVGPNRYFGTFLKLLFFEGFAKPEQERSAEARERLGSIRYLNGGLFLQHNIEEDNPKIDVPDKAFENLFALFERYSWNLNDTPGGEDNEINPDVLGYIFEKYINQKAFGAYYTRPEITEYLCEATIYRLILNAINTPATIETHHIPGVKNYQYQNIPDLIMDLDAPLCRQLLNDVLAGLSLLDPACGSGAFLVAAMKTLINLYAAIIGKIKFLNDRNLSAWLAQAEREHKSLSYFIKKRIITDNLYGVDIMEEATEIAKLRLFLALVASAETADQLEPLPNIDFNILAGNSLIGLLRVDDQDFAKYADDLATASYFKDYRQALAEKNRLVETYRHASVYAEDLRHLRHDIEDKKRTAKGLLDRLLLDQFQSLGIKYEEATWDEKKNKEGKTHKRPLSETDIQELKPFHWGYEFDEILNKRGGFDAIITNPPWEIFKPIAKEFCYEYDPEVERRGTDIKDFEKRLVKLLEQPKVREKYLAYLSRFPHISAFFRSAPQYKNQITVVDGKKAGTDINLYKLFTEQCFNLLRQGGHCGIVIPSGIYTDLGAKQLREMLFSETNVTGLFGFENRKEIFDGVHRSYKFIVLTFENGGVTKQFPAAFMRLDVQELDRFPQEGAIEMSVDLIRRLSPGSLSIMEFKNDLDVRIAEKMLRFPLLGNQVEGAWNLKLTAEFHMTNDSRLFKTSPGPGRLPLYEGKMIWHYEHGKSGIRYWINEREGVNELLAARVRGIRTMLRQHGLPEEVNEEEIILGYSHYRVGIRAVTGATNERTLVVSVIPKMVFAGNSILVSLPVRDEIEGETWLQAENDNPPRLLFACSVLSSFAADWFIRQKILTNMNMFFLYEIPTPRLTEKNEAFWPIVERAARLICTTPEFNDLAKEVGLKSLKAGAIDSTERAKLRAELDGLIAHLYGLTEEEFAYILTTFPLVPDPVKEAARNAYRDVERGLVR